METILCDTSVYLAFLRQEPQGFHANTIFEQAVLGKYSFYAGSFDELYARLVSSGAVRPVEFEGSESLKQEARELNRKILAYDKHTKEEGRLGFVDCLFLVAARRSGATLIACDKELVRVANELGIPAFEPMDFTS